MLTRAELDDIRRLVQEPITVGSILQMREALLRLLAQYEVEHRKTLLLEILVQGCPEHKNYRAKREPIVWCTHCRVMWDAKRELVDTLHISC